MAKDAMSKRLADFLGEFARYDGDLVDFKSEPDLMNYPAVLAAFKRFRLDPQEPHHQRWLLVVLAHIVFGRRQRGPQPKWDADQFKADVAAAKQARPGRKDVEICRALKEDKHQKFGGRYKDKSVEALRHKLREIK
jgi:hypothetical protein